MSTRLGGQFTQIRRFTNNIVCRYRCGKDDFFCKIVHDARDARAEIDGYDAIRDFYTVPLRHSVSTGRENSTIFCYDYVSTVGRDSGLLADLIVQASVGPIGKLDNYVSEMTAVYRRVMLETGRRLPKVRVRTKLFEDRLLPNGRIDHYYGDLANCVVPVGGEALMVTRSSEMAFVINGTWHTFQWSRLLFDLRQYFTENHECTAAITQGDPTELNLGVPLMWFDFDNSGYNAILGEWATFLWYVYILGGYIVPKYAPGLFRDHPCVLPFLERRAPRLTSARRGASMLLDYEMDIGPARRILLSRYQKDVIEPVSRTLNMGRWENDLRFYLALRIIGVYDIFSFQPADCWFMLAKLAQCMNGETFRLERFLDMEPTNG